MVRSGGELDQADAEWLAVYNAEHPERSARALVATERIEEREVRETEATSAGPSPTEALALQMASREEGRRLDALLRQATDSSSQAMRALVDACDLHRKMAASLLADNQALHATVIAMLETVREHGIARASAEAGAAATAAAAVEGAPEELLVQALLARFGAGAAAGGSTPNADK
jgi:hypothetical protein